MKIVQLTDNVLIHTQPPMCRSIFYKNKKYFLSFPYIHFIFIGWGNKDRFVWTIMKCFFGKKEIISCLESSENILYPICFPNMYDNSVCLNHFKHPAPTEAISIFWQSKFNIEMANLVSPYYDLFQKDSRLYALPFVFKLKLNYWAYRTKHDKSYGMKMKLNEKHSKPLKNIANPPNSHVLNH